MNKQKKLLYFLCISSIILLNFNIVSAAFGDSIANQVNTIQDNVSNAQQTVDQIRSDYLQQEWTKIVSQNQYIGPIHNFFIANPFIFKLLFNEPYSFSLTFLLIVIIWFFVLILTKKITSAFFKSSWKSWVFGIALAMILAWSTIIKSFSTFIVQLTFAQQYWWMRAIIWLILFIIIMLIYYMDNMIAKNIKKSKALKKEEELEEKTEENTAFIEGAKKRLNS